MHFNLILYYSRLTTTNPDKFWTSGQWMTEKAGGSDVGNYDCCFVFITYYKDFTSSEIICISLSAFESCCC